MGKLSTLSQEKGGYANDWTPLECLRQLVADIESGDFECNMVYVAMRQIKEKDVVFQNFPDYAAGGSALELAGLLSYHLVKLTGSE